MVRIEGGTVRLKNIAVLTPSAGAVGILIDGGSPEIINNVVGRIRLAGSVTIPAGARWGLLQTEVAVPPFDRLDVAGTLNATGTTFTSTHGVDPWHGLRFLDGSAGTLRNATVERVGTGVTAFGAPGTAAITVFDAAPRIESTTVTALDAGTDGIALRGTAPAPQLIDNVVDRIVVEADVTLPTGARWDLLRSEVAFAPGTGLTVLGTLTSEGAAFTAVNPSQGWDGIRYEAGSDGRLAGGTSIERVAGWGTAALRITDASPSLDDVRIRNAALPSAVAGIHVSGPDAYPSSSATLNEVVIEGMTSDGIVLSNQANARITNSTAELNDGAGLHAGYRTRAFLYPALVGQRDEGNVFTGNDGAGIEATSEADLTLGYYYYPTGYHNNGFNSAVSNGDGGVVVRGGAGVKAGQSNNQNQAKNRFYNNVGSDGMATGTASRLYARCDWWNDTTPPFRTAQASGGILYTDHWLLQDPYVNESAPCTTAGGSAQANAQDGPAAWLVAGAEAPDAETALVHFSRVLAETPASPEAPAALAEIADLAEQPDAFRGVADRATDLLERVAATGDRTLRREATRGLIGVRLAEGDARGALALAEAVAVLAEGDAEAVHAAHLERAYLLAALGEPDAAAQALALAASEAVASDDLEDARRALGLRASAPVAAPLAASLHEADEARAVRLLAPSPNPTAAEVRVGVELPDQAEVRVSVYDALGRSMAVVHDGPLGAGTQTWALATTGWSPGVYLVRVAATGTGEVGGAYQTRFTVVR